MKFLNRNICLYLCFWGILALCVDYRQTQLNRLHYALGIFYNDHFTNFRDGVVYFDLKAHADPGNLKHRAHLAYAYYQLKDMPRVGYYQRQLPLVEQGYLSRLMSGQERLEIDLLPGEVR